MKYYFLTKGNVNVSATAFQRKVSVGFTIIELLVVVAIIAVLTGVVLVNVTSYLNKGKDAAAKANLSSMLVNGAVWNDSGASPTGTYNLWNTTANSCAGTPTFANTCNAITNAGYAITSTCDTVNCAATAKAWCACIQLKAVAGTYFCVDMTGAKTQQALNNCAAECSQTSITPGKCL